MNRIRLDLTIAIFVCLIAYSPARAANPAIQSRLSAPTDGRGHDRCARFAPCRAADHPAAAAQEPTESGTTTAERLRRDMLEQIVFRGRAPDGAMPAAASSGSTRLPADPATRSASFATRPCRGMWIPGLLYLPDNLAGKVPVAIHVNGHAPEGKAVEYKQLRSINLAKRGMLVLERGMVRHGPAAHRRLLALPDEPARPVRRERPGAVLPGDVASPRPGGWRLTNADPERVAVSGLSGGGWQTILISSLDERVTLANPVAGYGSFRTNIAFDDMGDSEQAPADMALVADYAHLTAPASPAADAADLQRQRRLLLQVAGTRSRRC